MHLIPCYCPKSKEKPRYISRRDYTEENIDSLISSLETTDWDELFKPDDDINTQVDVFTEYIKFCTDQHLPLVRRKVYANSKPWITKELLTLIQDKMKAFKAGNSKLVNKLKNKIKQEIHKSRKAYVEKLQKRMAEDPSKAWTDIKKISGLPWTNKTAETTDIEPDVLNQFFSRFEKPERNNIPDSDKQSSDAEDLPKCMFVESDVRKHLHRLNARKGPGPDHLIPRVLKLAAYQLAPVITSLFHASIEQRTTPTLWKTSIIKPVPKIAKPGEPKHFRPIAITSCLCKILEKVIKGYIMENTTLDMFQFAYLPNRSTQDAVLCLLTTVSTHIDRKATNTARCLFLDFSSAFNTINVQLLMPKLNYLHADIRGWIKSFLSDRPQYTKSDDRLSSVITTNTGTPQGTVLSPLLFALYTDMIRSEHRSVAVMKYADDTVIVGLISCQEDQDAYDSEISRLCNLCGDLDLILNSDKTKEMLFSTKRTPPAVSPTVIGGSQIELSPEIKYLGVTIDSKLKFSSQCQATISKANQRLYIVRRLKSLGAKPALLKQLYSSFIDSHIFYCLVVFYSNISMQDQKALRRLHNLGIKLQVQTESFDDILDNRTKSYVWKIFTDENHFIHKFVHRLPSGRLQSFKVRATAGRDCFLRKMILMINEAFR